MPKLLPPRPNLEQLRKQAKDLLKSLKSGDPEAIKRIQENHPRWRSEEHTSELQSQSNLVCRLLLEKKNSPPASRTILATRSTCSRVSAQKAIRVSCGQWLASSVNPKNSDGLPPPSFSNAPHSSALLSRVNPIAGKILAKNACARVRFRTRRSIWSKRRVCKVQGKFFLPHGLGFDHLFASYKKLPAKVRMNAPSRFRLSGASESLRAIPPNSCAHGPRRRVAPLHRELLPRCRKSSTSNFSHWDSRGSRSTFESPSVN